MKKMLTLLAASFLFYTSNAQQFSGGFRTGASHWMDKEKGKCFSRENGRKHNSWDKELFIRYNTKGKLAFEASLGHYSLHNSYTPDQLTYFAPPEYVVTNVNERSQSLELNLSAQYDVTCPALQQKCPAMKRLKSYAGVILTPTLSRNTIKTTYVDEVSSSDPKTSVSSKDEMTLWTGLTHTMVYSVCEHLYVSSALRLQIDPNSFFDKHESGTFSRDSRMGFQIGIGYNF